MDAPNPPSYMPKPDLFSKVGPLPAWAWGAIGLGGFFVFQHLHGKGTPQAMDNPVDGQGLDPNSVATADSGITTTPTDPSASGYNYGDVLAGDYQGSTGGTQFSTNQQWGVSAIGDLIRMGVSASVATTAVTLYLAGGALTAAQATAVGQAIAAIGPPPLPLPFRSVTPVAAVPVKPSAPTSPVRTTLPTTKPPAPTTYTIRTGDTLSLIALRHRTTVTHLWTRNGVLLDTVARRHGRRDSAHGRYIYAGTVIHL